MQRMIVVTLLAGIMAACSRPTPAPQEGVSDAGQQWWSHVQHLADDKLEGRNVGTKGFDEAARYVAEQFERAGLKPAGVDGYFQPVSFTQTTLDESASKVELIQKKQPTSVQLGEDIILGYGAHSAAKVNAPLVFVGHGLKIPEANYDDLKGAPLKGAIAVYIMGGPSSIPGSLRSHYSSREERWKSLRAAGAIGYISIQNPKHMDIPWARQASSRLMPHMSLADETLEETPGLQFSATWNPAKADQLFAGTGHTAAEMFDLANSEKPFPHFALQKSIRAVVKANRSQIESKNVAGVRPGSDPTLRNEYVVLSAHLDHLGIGGNDQNDRIFNGAMDNASGIASLIEVAKALNNSKEPVQRSVLFLAVTGEEKGLQGSRYYANKPTVHGRIVADLNMDMYLPLFPLKLLEVQGLNESTLGNDIRSVSEQAGVKVQPDQEPDKNLFIRSDQYSFIKKGVPALAFKFGFVPGSPEEKLYRDWFTNRYHAVSDDLQQPVDKAGAAKLNGILTSLMIRVANAPAAPEWKPDSFFRRFVPAKT